MLTKRKVYFSKPNFYNIYWVMCVNIHNTPCKTIILYTFLLMQKNITSLKERTRTKQFSQETPTTKSNAEEDDQIQVWDGKY